MKSLQEMVFTLDWGLRFAVVWTARRVYADTVQTGCASNHVYVFPNKAIKWRCFGLCCVIVSTWCFLMFPFSWFIHPGSISDSEFWPTLGKFPSPSVQPFKTRSRKRKSMHSIFLFHFFWPILLTYCLVCSLWHVSRRCCVSHGRLPKGEIIDLETTRQHMPWMACGGAAESQPR